MVFQRILFLAFFQLISCFERYPIGRYVEYTIEMPRKPLQDMMSPLMPFEDFRRTKPTTYDDADSFYRQSRPFYRPLAQNGPNFHQVSNERPNNDQEMPPFPFALPYQYSDQQPFSTPELPSYRSSGPKQWNNLRRTPQQYRQQFFDEENPTNWLETRRFHPRSAPIFRSRVDEIMDGINSMMADTTTRYPSESSTGFAKHSHFSYHFLI